MSNEQEPTFETPAACPLCDSSNVVGGKVGWAWICCRNRGLSMSKDMSYKELHRIWGTRDPAALEFLLAQYRYKPSNPSDAPDTLKNNSTQMQNNLF